MHIECDVFLRNCSQLKYYCEKYSKHFLSNIWKHVTKIFNNNIINKLMNRNRNNNVSTKQHITEKKQLNKIKKCV